MKLVAGWAILIMARVTSTNAGRSGDMKRPDFEGIAAIGWVLLALMGWACAADAPGEGPAVTLAPPVGTVKDGDGAPISGAEVLLYYNHSRWGLGNGIVETVRTDAAGAFR